MSQKFINNRLTLIVLISACVVIMISMGLRQTFGLFFQAFEEGIGCTERNLHPWSLNVIALLPSPLVHVCFENLEQPAST